MIIEYNGIQHYKPTKFGSMTEEDATISFERQKIRDCEMRKYCNDNHINLWEIDGRKYKKYKLTDILNSTLLSLKEHNKCF